MFSTKVMSYRRKKSVEWLHLLSLLVIFISILLVWEASLSYFDKLQFIFPPPSKIVSRIFKTPEFFLKHSLVTFTEMVCALSVAMIGSFILATIMLYSSLVSTVIQSLFVILQCLPMFLLAPLMLVCFGWSKLAIIIPTAIMISFPLTLNIYRGLNSVTKEFLEFFKIHRSHFLQILFYLRLPFALPQVFSGLRISISVAGVSAVAGEWAGGQEGLGLLIQESRRNADYTAIFGALVCLIVLSLVLYLGIYFIESLYQNYYLHINGTSKEN